MTTKIKDIRIIGSNKQLAGSIRSYLDQRTKMSMATWRREILPVLKNVENNILQQLKSFNLSEWHIANLNNILGQVQGVIIPFGNQYTASVLAGQERLGLFGASHLDKELSLVNLIIPTNPIIGEDLLAALVPLTEVFTDVFTVDLARIVKSEISLGLVNGDSTQVVAKKIRDNFGNTSEKIKLLNNKKSSLQQQFDKGFISKTEFKNKTLVINKQLEKGSMMSFARAERIAVTEMNRGASFARHLRGIDIQEENPQARRMWINLHKPGARNTHLKVESRTKANPIRLTQQFNVGGFKADFPLDPKLPAKELVWCGCTIVIVNAKDFSGLGTLPF